MSAPVDVLAVLDAQYARAAVVELIHAADDVLRIERSQGVADAAVEVALARLDAALQACGVQS